MAEKTFKYIKGSYAEGQPAHICFYSDVNEWRVNDFIYEFNYLINWVKPSEICVHINSSGGNCIDGISVFSLIQNCEIKVKTINDGLAASMASVIWAAGDEFFMKDYALLMIHNPFAEDKSGDKVVTQATEAFKKQLSIIYQKRFGFDEETTKKIMDGEEGNDGTWFTADEAVAAGFLKEDHVIETEKGVKDRIAASVQKVVRTPKNVVAVMQLENDMIKPADEKLPIIDKSNPISNLNNTTMTENEIKVVAAQLGFTGEKATSENVSARIKELLGVEAKYNDLKLEFETKSQALTAAETKNKGLETSVQNLQKNYDEVKSKLDVFEKAAAEKAKLEIEAMVDEAIAAGKIEKESRDTWISQAQANLELTKNVLGSIPARVKISKQINNDPNNVNAAEKGMTTAEQKVEEKVQATVGKDFKFREPKF